ncbi:hypothetical protein HPB49_023027 [Dermacentor silvarum]|uniref:Uncharacterized protein n=1 Tax=Dermacentor silvarum TaxID=543639 RepID=A0ACB8D0J1_DERSI|nr:hypothetical protein HPB49_023027 [Dermacentor silvarum]
MPSSSSPSASLPVPQSAVCMTAVVTRVAHHVGRRQRYVILGSLLSWAALLAFIYVWGPYIVNLTCCASIHSSCSSVKYSPSVLPSGFAQSAWQSLCRPAWAHQVQDLREVFRFARCRATCLGKLGLKTDKDDIECTADKECNMCWDVCEFFNRDFEVWKHMCTVDELCFPGCQQACSFWHKTSPTLRPGSAATRHTEEEYSGVFYEPPRLEARGVHDVRVTWSRPLSAQDDSIERALVYVLFLRGLLDDQRWDDAVQTHYHNATLSRSQLKQASELQIIALSPYGVFAQTRVALDFESEVFDSVQADASITSLLPAFAAPKVVKMRHSSGHLVEVDIAWDFDISPEATKVKYEVTWRVLDKAVDVTGRMHACGREPRTSIFVRRLSPQTGEPDAETLSRFLDTPVVEPEPHTRDAASIASCVRFEVVAACAVFATGIVFACVVAMALVAMRKSVRPKGEQPAVTKSPFTQKGCAERHSRRGSQLCGVTKTLFGGHPGNGPESAVGEPREDLLSEAQRESGGINQCFVYDTHSA